MPVLRSDAQAVRDLLRPAKRVVCVCHRGPDGDAIGSLLGLGLLIEKYAEKQFVLLCVDAVPEMFTYLPGVHRISKSYVFQEGDVAVTVDTAEPKLSKMDQSHPTLFDGTVPLINIDHHPGNTRFGTLNIIVPDAASTCEIIVELADQLHWDMSPDIATALLTGVYTDTGGLLHSSTTAGVYRTVARLLRGGARHQLIISAVYRTAQLSTLRLWGRVLEKISISEEGGAITAVTEGDFRATGADYSELAGAIDYVNAVPGMRFSMVLSERGGQVKGSLRTLRDDVDVSAMASKLHGGGHKKAAGFALEGRLRPELRWKVIEKEPASVPPPASS